MAVCGWSERYVGGCWPDWIKNPDRVKGGVAAQKILAEQREQQKLIQKVTEKLPAINFVEPKEHERSDATAYVRNQEEVRQEEEIRQIDQHSPFHIVGEINRYLAKLWTALTGLKNMPHMADDVKISYIKPTRDFRKNIANGIPKADRIQVNNWILWVEMALEDMRDTLEKADATAFDR